MRAGQYRRLNVIWDANARTNILYPHFSDANLTKHLFFILFFKLPRCDMRVVPAVSNACYKGRGVLQVIQAMIQLFSRLLGLGLLSLAGRPLKRSTEGLNSLESVLGRCRKMQLQDP